MSTSFRKPPQEREGLMEGLRRSIYWLCRRLSQWLCRRLCPWFPRWLCRLFHRPPRYQPEMWNDEGAGAEECTCNLATETKIQCKNNCYNYACNLRTDTFAQPGRAGGYTPAAINCEEYTKAAKADGLIEVDCAKPCPKCCHKVALVIWPGVDFHWYRQDANGMWSHKPGKTAARNTDNSGNPIGDPRTADRGPYTQFCGCFCVCKCRIRIS